jgi:predicted small secreted protein
MNIMQKNIQLPLLAAITAVAFATAGCSTMGGGGGEGQSSETRLSGAQEVPPVSTEASGQSTIKIAPDKSVSGMVLVSRLNATAAHIHEGAKGANGPVIVPLTKTSDTTFVVPADAKITDAQYASYKAGKLYINVHSAAHPAGEIRGQLNPR